MVAKKWTALDFEFQGVEFKTRLNFLLLSIKGKVINLPPSNFIPSREPRKWPGRGAGIGHVLATYFNHTLSRIITTTALRNLEHNELMTAIVG